MHSHDGCCSDHSIAVTPVSPVDQTRMGSSSRVHYDLFGHLHPDTSSKHTGLSWRRLWTVILREHGFIGGHLYAGLAHLLVGICVWTAGVYVGSLALLCYAFVVIFDACSLLIDVVPRLLEYSNNTQVSLQHPFGQQAVPTVFRFTNSLVLLYRSVQALKEGVEHLMVHGHQHGVSAEFESYARSGDGHAGDTKLVTVCIVMALAVTVNSAARYANHRILWQLRTRRIQQQDSLRPLNNTLGNPYNFASLVAGLWMAVAFTLQQPSSTNGDDSIIEPLSCIAMAIFMAYISFPTCVSLGKALLLAATPETAAEVRVAVEQVRKLPGVKGCAGCYVWSVAQGNHVVMRVDVDESMLSLASYDQLQSRIDDVLKTVGLTSLAVDLRTASSR
ncbi:hypothetical protein H4R99_007888 [Coemansia sp. RSA 1722]|nr:hypothetical protein IWW45_008610 [Coemansia sp. RSA 485]KAJ2588193.1 hypothetical protein H4R99_007888 [Coemansia sp. RSA 1722]